jgi:holo-[acyl-carrier protein] synthase
MIEGTDVGLRLLSISRLGTILDRFPLARHRFFTEDERTYCQSRKRRPEQHFAARMAAKLACRSLLGPIRLREVEVVRDAMGAPRLRLHGRAAELGRGMCLRVSLSHDGDMAGAIVTGEAV